ncbi:chromosome partitioning protein [Bradyrhizobium sp. USDA 4341]
MENTATARQATEGQPFDDLILADAQLLSAQLHAVRERIFPPDAAKVLRKFTPGEAVKLLGITDSYLRQLSRAKGDPELEVGPTGKRLYTLDQIHEMRRLLSSTANGKVRPSTRSGQEHLQVVAVTNFKGGSGKTTTAAHLAQYLALHGYRVLAVDLDAQASLTSLFGLQSEFDVAANETVYASIRYDEKRRSLSEIIRPTYFSGLDLVPANLEIAEFEYDAAKHSQGRKQGEPFFFERLAIALEEVQQNYDVVVIDCPPQLGYLTLSALCTATSVLVTVHPQMLDIASMSQFLLMTSDLLSVVRGHGGQVRYDFMRYVVTRHEPNDGPQAQIVGMMRSLFGDRVLTSVMLKSTAVSDAGLQKQTLYEVGRESFTRSTYDRAIESLDGVNLEIENLLRKAWGRAA